ncbi:hypothetical protein [Parvibaculum sp.]|uniref:hypothetical protein n=1 Tax=Parvibaculum sp. TaxID=2024848 RepID=UPI000C3F9771|nr:hypothetical protein [Parvibaculum sp.]MAM94774.1 hypothetical protein [Parvibaculum sp.]
MSMRMFVLAGLFAAGFSGPAAADAVRWIDPWAPHDAYPELAGGPSDMSPITGARAVAPAYRQDGTVWIDPWGASGAGEDCACGEQAEVTGSLGLAGFNGGVGNRQSIVVIQNGYYFNRFLPAGQVAMTGARAAPVHPLGHPRF